MPDPTPEQTARWRKWTVRLLLAVTVGLAAYDLAAYAGGGQNATITQVVFDTSQDFPLVAVLAGIIVAHIFWANRTKST